MGCAVKVFGVGAWARCMYGGAGACRQGGGCTGHAWEQQSAEARGLQVRMKGGLLLHSSSQHGLIAHQRGGHEGGAGGGVSRSAVSTPHLLHTYLIEGVP